MDNSSVEPKKHSRNFYYSFALVAILIVVFAVTIFAFQNPAQDPLLYNNTILIQAETNKQVYTQREDIQISTYVVNGKDETIVYPKSITYRVLDSEEQEVYAVQINITPSLTSSFAAHSKTLFNSHVWNQKDINYTLVESGNYTIEVSLEYGTFECKIQIMQV